jgi:hypothetical protein
MKAICIKCKCCEAQPGFVLCVFCEDGVLCPNQKRRGDSLPMPEPEKEAVMSEKNCACGCGQTLKPDAKHPYLRGHKPKKEKGQRLCACGCGTALVNRHPFIKGHNANADRPAKKDKTTHHAAKVRSSPPPSTERRPRDYSCDRKTSGRFLEEALPAGEGTLVPITT